MAQIALVGPFYPFRGGIAHFNEAMYRGLAARGHDVRAYTFSRQYPERLFPGKTQHVDGPNRTGIEAAPVLDTVGPRSWWRAAEQIADGGAEVAVFPYWMPFLAPSLGTMARRLRRRGVRSVAVVHNALPHERRPGDRALTRYALSPCSGLLVLSDQVRQDVKGLGVSAPIEQVRHPVYEQFGPLQDRAAARTALGLAPGAPVVLFFGFVRRYKGLHVLLDAMPRVLQAIPDLTLLVAGEFYADEAELRAQARPLGAAVRFYPDYIPDEQVGQYFAAADAVVQPYVTATQSGVAQVAFHYERPVVTTDVGGLAEIVPDGVAGLVVPPENPAALAAALVRFYQNDLRDALTAGVRREKATYSWDHVVAATERLGGLSGPERELDRDASDE